MYAVMVGGYNVFEAIDEDVLPLDEVIT